MHGGQLESRAIQVQPARGEKADQKRQQHCKSVREGGGRKRRKGEEDGDGGAAEGIKSAVPG